MRILSIDPPPNLTPEQIQQFQKEAEQARLACFVAEDPFYQFFHQYNPVWTIDPGPEETSSHAWQAVVNGLVPGEIVQVTGANEQALAVATASASGAALISVLVAPDLQGAELGLQRTGNSTAGLLRGARRAPLIAPAASSTKPAKPPGTSGIEPGSANIDPRRGMIFRQVLLGKRGIINLPVPGRFLAPAFRTDLVALAVVLPTAVQIYDVSNPLFPVQLSSWVGEELFGVVNFAGDMFAWGFQGISPLSSPYQSPYYRFTHCKRDPSLSAAAGAGFLYVLRCGSVAIYDTKLCEVGKLEIQGHSLAIAGPSLAVATANEIVIFNLGDAMCPHRAGCFQLCNPGCLVTPSVFGGRAVIGVSHDGGDLLLDVSKPDKPVELLHFNGPAWYAGTAQAGRVVA